LKFLHAADVHLDSPLKGLERYEGAPVDEIRSATRRALENLVELAIDQQVDFVLIAGDVYDGDWKDHNTGLFFVRQMTQLREAGIPVIMIRGNHDAESKMTKSLKLPDNVETLSHRRPETARTRKLGELGVAIHGRSYAKPAELDNMVMEYPEAVPGLFNIGLLHTSLIGAERHEPYAPCTVSDLQSKGYDYWALGHIHKRESVSDNPHIVFSGNIQGRHIGETGEKGCVIVNVDDRHGIRAEFEPLDVFRWETCDVDASGAENGEAVLERFSDRLMQLVEAAGGRSVAMRVEIKGACRAHQELLADPVEWTNQIRGAALDRAPGVAWIEKVKFRTLPAHDVNEILTTDGAFGELLEFLRSARNDETVLQRFSVELADLRSKLPDELTKGDDALGLNDPDWLGDVLSEVEPLLRGRMSTQEAGR